MRNLMITWIALSVILVFSCKKDDNGKDGPTPTPPSSYLRLTPGTYWVYDHYKIDSLGNATKVNQTDSIVVTRDTMINNKKYYVFEGSAMMSGSQWKILGYYRDSAQCLVDATGQILFSETNFTDTLSGHVAYANPPDTIYQVYTMMEDPGVPITVPAGTFQALSATSYFTIHSKSMSMGNDIIHTTINRYYGNGVGEISSSYMFLSEYLDSRTYRERRLVRYSIGM